MTRTDPLTLWRGLFEGDLFTLPDELTELRAGAERVDAELARCADTAPDPAGTRETLRRQYATAAVAGAKWPDPATVVEAERASQAHEAKVEALTAARADLADDLVEAVHARSDRLIIETIRPAFEVIVTEIRTVADALPADLSADAVRPTFTRQSAEGVAGARRHHRAPDPPPGAGRAPAPPPATADGRVGRVPRLPEPACRLARVPARPDPAVVRVDPT